VPVGRPDIEYAPSQFIPFDPFLSGGMYRSAAAPLYAVFLRNAICGVSRLRRDTIHTRLESARGCLLEAVSSLLMVEQAKFARLKASLRLLPFRFAPLQSVLTRKFLPAPGIFGWRRLLGLSQPERR
jgi:hypothetical protein